MKPFTDARHIPIFFIWEEEGSNTICQPAYQQPGLQTIFVFDSKTLLEDTHLKRWDVYRVTDQWCKTDLNGGRRRPYLPYGCKLPPLWLSIMMLVILMKCTNKQDGLISTVFAKCIPQSLILKTSWLEIIWRSLIRVSLHKERAWATCRKRERISHYFKLACKIDQHFPEPVSLVNPSWIFDYSLLYNETDVIWQR